MRRKMEQEKLLTVAAADKLAILGLPRRRVELREFRGLKIVGHFQTVNEISKIVHSTNGDYLAVLETKYGGKFNYVRIYVNWRQLRKSKIPARPNNFRAIGRNCPSPKCRAFEAIEIFGDKNPNNIECCQLTGNLLFQTNYEIVVYRLRRIHENGVDFERSSVCGELLHVPRKLAFCGNFVAYTHKDSCLVGVLIAIEEKKVSGPKFNFGKNEEETMNEDSPKYNFYNLMTKMASCTSDSFDCLLMKPVHVPETVNSAIGISQRNFSPHQIGVACFFADSCSGFLMLLMKSSRHCLFKYSFDSPVTNAVLTSNYLHVLTRDGHLNTYFTKLRDILHISHSEEVVAERVHTQRFQGFRWLLSNNSVHLLLIKDQLPIKWIVTGINVNRYLQELKDLTMLHSMIQSSMSLVTTAPPFEEKVKPLQTVSAYLGHHCLVGYGNVEAAMKYFKMAAISPREVLENIYKTSSDWKTNGYNKLIVLKYLVKVITREDVENDQGFFEEVEDMMLQKGEGFLVTTILNNKAFQTSSQKFLDYLLGRIYFKTTREETQCLLAIAVLYHTFGMDDEAMQTIAQNYFCPETLLEHWEIFFTSPGLFSPLCKGFLMVKSMEIVDLLIKVMIKSDVDAGHVFQAVTEFGMVDSLQEILEGYLHRRFWFKTKEELEEVAQNSSGCLIDIIQTLMISYWNTLKNSETYSNQGCLFKKLRFQYLDFVSSELNSLTLVKIEAILCSPFGKLLDVKFLNILTRFLFGPRSIFEDPEELLQDLSMSYPEALFQFGKDRFTNHRQWRSLIFIASKKAEESEVFERVLDESLRYLARSMSPDEFKGISSGIDREGKITRFKEYVQLCENHVKVNRVQQLIDGQAALILSHFKG